MILNRTEAALSGRVHGDETVSFNYLSFSSDSQGALGRVFIFGREREREREREMARFSMAMQDRAQECVVVVIWTPRWGCI